jgi:hypothetical protein
VTHQAGNIAYTGVGVGDASASPTAALLLSIIQESMGRVATILFAHQLGTALEPECKMYRLAADVFNDTAMVLDCLSPILPKAPRVLLLGCSSVLRALCGVAAGSSKASLSAHFAKWGNLGELNAVCHPPSCACLNRLSPTVCTVFSIVLKGISPHLVLVHTSYCTLCRLTFKQKDSSQETVISLMGMLVHPP